MIERPIVTVKSFQLQRHSLRIVKKMGGSDKRMLIGSGVSILLSKY